MLSFFHAAVESDQRARREVEGVALLGRVAYFLFRRTAPGHHVAVAAQHVVNLFFLVMSVRDIRAARGEVHEKEAVDLLRRRQFVPLALGRAHQQFELGGRPMARQHL